MNPLIKRYWPWALGGAVGLYLVYHYSSSSTSASSSNPYASMLTASQAASAASAQYAAAQYAGQAQLTAATGTMNQQTLAGEAAYNASLGQLATNVGQAYAGIVSAQSILPATAINAASINNQTVLQNAAATAVGAMNATTAGIQAASQGGAAIGNAMAAETQSSSNLVQTATNAQLAPLLDYYNAMGQMYAVNATTSAQNVQSVSQAAAAGTLAAGQAAASASNANAQAQIGMWHTIGQIGSSAVMAGAMG